MAIPQKMVSHRAGDVHMTCPLCGHPDPIVNAGGTVLVDDKTPGVQTKVYYTQFAFCRDPTCPNHSVPICKIKHQQYPETPDGEAPPDPIIEMM